MALDIPREIVIEVTPLCNMKCKFCFNKNTFYKNTRNVGMVSNEKVKNIIDQCKKLGIEAIRFTGGEPLVRKDIMELLEYAHNSGLYVMMNTNAVLVTKEVAIELKKYVQNILVSYLTENPDKEDEITGITDSFKKRFEGLQNLIDVGIPYVRVSTIASNETIPKLDDFYNVLKDYKIDAWEILRAIPQSKEEPSISKEQAEILINKAIEYNKKGFRTRISTPLPFCVTDLKKADEVCLGAQFDEGHTRFVIDPRGFAKPTYYSEINIGDPDDLMACWNHPFMKKMRNQEFLPKACQNCPVKDKCLGGSRYIAHMFTNEYTGKDPLMNMSLN